MELKDFIAKTLSEISIGIIEGNDLTQKHNYSYAGDGGIGIDFDISVSYDENNTSGAGAKITVASLFSGGVNAENKVANSNLSRIKFSVKLEFKTQKVTIPTQ